MTSSGRVSWAARRSAGAGRSWQGAKIAENGRTRTAPLVAITTPATIAIPSRGIDGPQNNTIIINQIMLYVKDLIIVDNLLEDLIV